MAPLCGASSFMGLDQHICRQTIVLKIIKTLLDDLSQIKFRHFHNTSSTVLNATNSVNT